MPSHRVRRPGLGLVGVFLSAVTLAVYLHVNNFSPTSSRTSSSFQEKSDQLRAQIRERQCADTRQVDRVKASSNSYITDALFKDTPNPHDPALNLDSSRPVEWRPKFNASHAEHIKQDHTRIREYNNYNFELDDWLFYATAYSFGVPLPEMSNEFGRSDSPYFSYTVYKPPFVENALNSVAQSCILMLVRNSELEGAVKTIRRLEDRFNTHHRYDWVFLNDVPFTAEFITRTSAMVSSSRIKYGLIPKEHWGEVPDHIDLARVEERMQLLEDQGVLYGGSLSYRHMCRFQSTSFYKHPAVQEYRYYMRTEPDVEYFCDFGEHDPFKVMEEQGKKYGFIVSLHEYEDTIPTLWEAVEEFIELQDTEDESADGREFAVGDGFSFLTDMTDHGPDLSSSLSSYTVDVLNGDYNLCHFWSNFEVGDMDGFFRTPQYNEFVDFLNFEKEGFYMERWGDAPVHSIAAMLFLNKTDIVHFDTLGYFHAPFGSCPLSANLRLKQKCVCDADAEYNIDIQPYSCLTKWWKNGDGKRFLL